MGSKAFHLEKAQRNEKFYQTRVSGSPPFYEWAVTTIFYTALHYVDAVLAEEDQDPRTHNQRFDAIVISPSLSPVLEMYRNLYWRSLEARYTRMSFPPDELRGIENVCFQPTRRFVRQLLGLPVGSSS